MVNSRAVAQEHDLQVADGHCTQAVTSTTPEGAAPKSGTASCRTGSRREESQSRKRKTPGFAGRCDSMRILAYWSSDPDGIRTRVAALKGPCPRPLDDGAGRLRNNEHARGRCTARASNNMQKREVAARDVLDAPL